MGFIKRSNHVIRSEPLAVFVIPVLAGFVAVVAGLGEYAIGLVAAAALIVTIEVLYRRSEA